MLHTGWSNTRCRLCGNGMDRWKHSGLTCISPQQCSQNRLVQWLQHSIHESQATMTNGIDRLPCSYFYHSSHWIGKWSLWLSCFRINAWHKIRARSDLRHDVRHIIYVYMENLQQTSLCGACSSLPQIAYPPHDISGMHRNENVHPKLNPPSLSQPYTPPPVAHQMVVENCGEQSRANAHINGITCSWKLAYYGNTMKGRGQ